MYKFNKIVILDKILILPNQWKRLKEMTSELVEFVGIDPDEIFKRMHEKMGIDQKPMCWTQLAQEEITKEELSNRINGADAIITCWTAIPDDVILKNEQIKYIGFWTNLSNHRINYKLAKDRGIYITTIPDYGTDSVAELTFSGILAITRRLFRSHQDTLKGNWLYEYIKTGQHIPKVNEISTHILRDKKIGIVGFGRIGKRVAEIALAFKMNIQYWSKNRYLEWEQKGAEFVNLEELFRTSDIVTIHLSPYAPQKIIHENLIKSLKDGAIFVNTSCGSILDQRALFEELSSNRIYAFLDVYDSLPPRKMLKSINTTDNIFTYRAGWYTQEAIVYKGECLLKNIENYINGNYLSREKHYLDDEDSFELPCRKN